MTTALITEIYGEDIKKVPFQVLIQLDRYTVKELDLSKAKVGDVIVAVVDDSNPKYPKKDFGKITKIENDIFTFDGEIARFDGKEVISFDVPAKFVSLPKDVKWVDSVDRMVLGQLAIEKKYKSKDQKAFGERVRGWLHNEKIVPGGRIQSSLGAKEKFGSELFLTAYNCFVIPSPKDSRGGIIESLLTQTEIMSRGGGVGKALSTLRPRNAKVFGVNGKSSGAVSWGGLYSHVTGLIEQGGSRRGALMLQLHVSHPDIYEFINAKRKAGQIENANLSVQITLEFKEAVDEDKDWHLIFPDTKHPEYDTNWGTKYEDIHDWLEAGLPVVIHETVKAKDLFNEITNAAHSSAEPGIVVYDYMNDGRMTSTQDLVQVEGTNAFVLREESRVRSYKKLNIKPYNNTYYYQKNVATNPCGEQPLPKFGICNLVHINLSELWDRNKLDVNWAELKQLVFDAIRFADNVIDYTGYFLEENKKTQLEQRRIGMGTLGLHDLLIEAKLRYGSDESIEFIDKLYAFIKNNAYLASSELAAARGAFETFDLAILEARVPSSLDEEVKDSIRKNGLRNSHLLTQAPTGTTGTKTGKRGYSVSTGIEPFVAIKWRRDSRLGTTYDFLGKAKEYVENTGEKQLPDYFVSALGAKEDGTPEILPIEHVKVQAAIQKHNDSAISKTTNAPSSFTLEQTQELYLKAIEMGLVGITIYRDESREEQVLTAVTDDETTETQVAATTAEAEPVVKKFYRRPTVLDGKTYKTQTPFGKAYVTVNRNPDPVNPNIEEVFINLGKTGADIAAIADGLAIALTGMLSPRIANLTEEEKVNWIIKKFKGITGQTSVGFGTNRVDSLPDAIAKVFVEMVQGQKTQAELEQPLVEKPQSQKKVVNSTVDICPECGKATYVKQDGCITCLPDLGGCGASKCM